MTSVVRQSYLALFPLRSKVSGTVRVPPSKSITNRVLIMAALAEGTSTIQHGLQADDSRLMIAALRALGIGIEDHGSELTVIGCGGRIPAREQLSLDVGEAGTVARFLLPLLCLSTACLSVTAGRRMSERPMEELLHALHLMGAEIDRGDRGRGFPLSIIGGGRLKGGAVEIAAGVSSQFASALLMVAPLMEHDLVLRLTGEMVSRGYLELTRTLMEEWGIQSRWLDAATLRVPAGQRYQARRYPVEGDASSASYFFAMAAISGGSVEVQGLTRQSKQADVGLVDLLVAMGCEVEERCGGIRLIGPHRLRGITADMSTMSDVAPTLAVVALFAEGVTTITGITHLRWKECDRLAAVIDELRKVGGAVEGKEDNLVIIGGQPLRGGRMATYNDHRMAMAFSLLSLRVEGIIIENPSCVAKTYPQYFRDFHAVSSSDQ